MFPFVKFFEARALTRSQSVGRLESRLRGRQDARGADAEVIAFATKFNQYALKVAGYHHA